MTRPVGHLARACSPHIIGHWLDVGSIRRGILCVKRYNSISIQQVAAYILRVVSSYVRLCAEKQKQRRHAACSLRDTSALLQCRSLARKPPPREFFSKSPPTERVSASAVADRTLHCQVRIRCFCFANATHAHLPVSLGCSSHRARRHRSLFSVGRGACHCRHTRAAMVSPTASQLCRQSHAFRAVPHLVSAALRWS